MAESKYTASSAVTQALEKLEEKKKNRPEEYRSVWGDQLSGIMDQILNREGFHYNLNGDALYKQYRDQALRNGRLAMMDTVGQSAALTGGYGNSWAQNAGQQAYHQELAALNDRIPELYALALEQYRQEGDALNGKYALLAGQEDRDYARFQDALTAWQKEVGMLQSAYGDAAAQDYSRYRDTVKDAQWQAEYDEAKRRFDLQWAADHPQQEESGKIQTVYVPVDNSIKKKLDRRKKMAVKVL